MEQSTEFMSDNAWRNLTQVRLKLISNEAEREPCFPDILAAKNASFDHTIVLLPERTHIEKHGGMDAFLKDVTATYQESWNSKGGKFIQGLDPEGIQKLRKALDYMTTLQQLRKAIENGDQYWKGNWDAFAEEGIKIMVKQMVWWEFA